VAVLAGVLLNRTYEVEWPSAVVDYAIITLHIHGYNADSSCHYQMKLTSFILPTRKLSKT